MRTIIRLQRKGPKNMPTWRFVVQGSYKKLKGMTIENLGYYVPKKMDEHERSLILNKNRTRYWLAMGVVLGNKVQRFLCAYNMAPAPWISFGKSTSFPRPQQDIEKTYLQGVDKLFKAKSFIGNTSAEIIAKIEQKSAENVYFRRIKFQERFNDYLEIENKDEFLQKIIEQTDQEISQDSFEEKSYKFYQLKKIYDEIEQQPNFLPTYKKEMIYRRLNQLAEKGLMAEEEVQKIEEKTDLKNEDNKMDLIEQAMLKKYESNQRKTSEKLDYLESLLNSIDRSEFISRCRENTELSQPEFNKKIEDYMKVHRDVNAPFTLLDVEYFCRLYIVDYLDVQKYTNLQVELKQPNISRVYVPSTYSITPFPDMETYNPNDWYDMRESTTNKIRAYTDMDERWFDLPLTQAKKRADKIEMQEKFEEYGNHSGKYKDHYAQQGFSYPELRKKQNEERKIKIMANREKKAAKEAVK